jgi:phage/plasmid-associated DNA primase
VHVLPIFWGTGANGKTTLVNVVLEIMGQDYSMKANRELLLVQRYPRHPTELAQIWGMRLVAASETHQGAVHWIDPAQILTDAGLTPDPWQATLHGILGRG